MTITDTVDYDIIEPRVRELCRALNTSGLARTLWSCEGHRPTLFGETRPAHPFVIFRGTELVAKTIQASLYQARLDSRLLLDWTVGGNFPPERCDPEDVHASDWQWNIRPWQQAMDWLSFGLQRKFWHDLERMPKIVREALLQLQVPGKQSEPATIIKHPGRCNDDTHRDEAIKHACVGTLSERIWSGAIGARSLGIRGNTGTANAAGLQNSAHDEVPYCFVKPEILAHRTQTRKAIRLISAFGLALALSACVTDQDVELQKDGSGTDEPRPSPCVGAPGSPCSPIPYSAPGLVWGRG